MEELVLQNKIVLEQSLNDIVTKYFHVVCVSSMKHRMVLRYSVAEGFFTVNNQMKAITLYM